MSDLNKDVCFDDQHEHDHNTHTHEHSHEHEHSHVHEHSHTHEHKAEPHEHTHVLEDGTVVIHSHTHHDGSTHGHYHSPEEKKRQLNRLSRVIGHLQHVKKMIENDEDCSDVLMQLSASKSALNGLGKEIMNEHLSHCISHAIENGDKSSLEEFQKAIQRFF